MPGATNSQHDRTMAKYHFLCTLESLEMTPALEEDDCIICKEPYQNNAWELGGTFHRPVKLPCGHKLGFQCLARWMVSLNFINHCPLCRGQIIAPLTTPRHRLSRPMASSFASLETLAVVASNGVSPSQRTRLLGVVKNALWSEKRSADSGDRIMVAWEEFFNQMCDESAAVETRAARRPRQDDELGLGVEIALVFSFAAMAYIPTGLLWDRRFGRVDSLTAMSLELFLGLFSCVVAVAVWDKRCKAINLVSGAICGMLLALIVRQIEASIFEWWTVGMYVFQSVCSMKGRLVCQSIVVFY